MKLLNKIKSTYTNCINGIGDCLAIVLTEKYKKGSIQDYIDPFNMSISKMITFMLLHKLTHCGK